MDTAGFMAWLKAEQQAALSEPALKTFDLVLEKSPESAAQSLAGLIDRELKRNVNWQEQFEQAAPILANWQPERSEAWKYKTYFVQYLNAFKAEARARVFSQIIEQSWPPNTHIAKFDKAETEILEFRRDVIKRGESYFLLWDDCKKIFSDENLPEDEFILSDIDQCEEEIERWKNKTHSFRDAWIGILKANIRVHRKRLEEINKERITQKKDQKKVISSKKEPEVLPRLEEAIKDAATFLPKLWNALAGMPAPLVSRSGTFIWSGENVSVLMALAQALKTAGKASDNYSTEQVYRILCRHFKTQEAKRPRIKSPTGFTYSYSEHLAAFNDTLEGL